MRFTTKKKYCIWNKLTVMQFPRLYHPMLNLPVVKLENANTPDWPAEGAFTFIKELEFHCSV